MIKFHLMRLFFAFFVSVNNLGISIATLDAARNNGLISYVQYVQNGCVYFTSAGLQEYIAKCTHRAKPAEKNATYRKPRRVGV